MAFSLLLILIPIIFLFMKHFLFGNGRHLPPGPNALHVLYHLYSLIHKPHIALQNLTKTYGPLFSFKLGGQIIVVASSPETAKELCRVNDRVFSGRHLPAVYHNLPGTMYSSIVLSPECGASWKLLRCIGRSCVFSSTAVESNAPIRKAKAADMVDFLRSKQGEAVDLEDIMFATLANVVSSALTSTNLFDLHARGTNDYKMRKGLVDEVIQKATVCGLVDFLPILRRVDFWSKGQAMDLHRKIKITWGGIIQKRRLMKCEKCCSSQDFLGMVIDNGTLSDDQIGNALTELLIGGTDSSTIITVWLVVELIRNQEMLSRVREEIAKTVKGDELSETLLSECHYLQACIKETLRLHVPAPLLVPHRAIETCKVSSSSSSSSSSYVIPKDSMVLVNAWAIARDPEYWEDAMSFKPERFLDSSIGYRGSNFEYLPFGTGLRMCPGSTVAFKNIQVIAASLLHYFDWSLPNGEHPTKINTSEVYVTTLKKENPLVLIPNSRL